MRVDLHTHSSRSDGTGRGLVNPMSGTHWVVVSDDFDVDNPEDSVVFEHEGCAATVHAAAYADPKQNCLEWWLLESEPVYVWFTHTDANPADNTDHTIHLPPGRHRVEGWEQRHSDPSMGEQYDCGSRMVTDPHSAAR